MNFLEQELWKLFGDGQIIGAPACSGRACFGTLNRDLRARAEFIATQISGQYDALRLTVLNRTEGVVDKTTIRLLDVWGKKPVPGNPNFRKGISPHIWDDHGKMEWYAYRPTAADYETIRQAAAQYLSVFHERTLHGPKLVYICAPLRGAVEKNIEFARQKAQEVFQAGEIPICPHLMFPPIARPDDPAQDQTAREMGLRLVETCQEVRVYGAVTEGMQVEIDRAVQAGVAVKFEQNTPVRSQPRRQAARKGRDAR